MSLSNPSFAATNLSHGLDADKPVSCKAGDIYIAEDTGIKYTCFVAGTWEQDASIIPCVIQPLGFSGSVVQGTWIFNENAAADYGSFFQTGGSMQNTSHAINDEYSFGSYMLPKGDYLAYVFTRKSASHGVVHLTIDGVDVAQFDCYAAATTENNYISDTFSIDNVSGDVNIKIASKNAAATDYYQNLQGLVIRRVA